MDKYHIIENSTSDLEETVKSVAMGAKINQICVKFGIIYARLSPIMRYLGYSQSLTPKQRSIIGADYFEYIQVGKQNSWFVNYDGFQRILEQTIRPIKKFQLIDIEKIYNINRDYNQPGNYYFSAEDMIYIIQQVNNKPINKKIIIDLLLQGKV